MIDSTWRIVDWYVLHPVQAGISVAGSYVMLLLITLGSDYSIEIIGLMKAFRYGI